MQRSQTRNLGRVGRSHVHQRTERRITPTHILGHRQPTRGSRIDEKLDGRGVNALAGPRVLGQGQAVVVQRGEGGTPLRQGSYAQAAFVRGAVEFNVCGIRVSARE